MYDTIKSYLKYDDIKDCQYLERIPSLLSKVSVINKENGLTYITGNLDCMHLSISQMGISLNGSLTKFYNGNNYHQLTRKQTELSIEKLEDVLNVNIKDSQMKRIDISHNFIMNQPAISYYYFLGTSTFYNRFKQPNSIYYNNHKKVKLFYDKILECDDKKVEVPDFIKSKNLLRYELRLMSRINNQLNNNVKLESLYDEQVYMQIIDLWIDEYNNINKNKLLRPMDTNTELTPKTAKDILLCALIEKVGMNEVIELTDQWNESFTNAKSKRRFINELNSMKELAQESDLILELDKKVNKLKEFYR